MNGYATLIQSYHLPNVSYQHAAMDGIGIIHSFTAMRLGTRSGRQTMQHRLHPQCCSMLFRHPDQFATWTCSLRSCFHYRPQLRCRTFRLALRLLSWPSIFLLSTTLCPLRSVRQSHSQGLKHHLRLLLHLPRLHHHPHHLLPLPLHPLEAGTYSASRKHTLQMLHSQVCIQSGGMSDRKLGIIFMLTRCISSTVSWPSKPMMKGSSQVLQHQYWCSSCPLALAL